mmetsp:Transcript_73587/g.225077  ORF Transcript_73587/g.225077 Transcript_73587/m.225077 type:complete len:1037 (-) Transcript_73587:69-3179(-)
MVSDAGDAPVTLKRTDTVGSVASKASTPARGPKITLPSKLAELVKKRTGGTLNRSVTRNVTLEPTALQVDDQCEILSTVTVRTGESLESECIKDLKAGPNVQILELGQESSRRVKISAPDGTVGWISSATAGGESLLCKCSELAVVQQRGGGGGLFGVSSEKIKSMLEAARSGDLDALIAIVEGGSNFRTRPNLNLTDARSKTALIYAAGFGNKNIVEYIVGRREVKINAEDDTQKNALHHACRRARNRRCTEFNETQSDIVDLLLQNAAQLEARDYNGATALMFAAGNGDELVVRRLLAAEANVNVRDFEGHSPLDYAHMCNCPAMKALLLEAGGIAIASKEESAALAVPSQQGRRKASLKAAGGALLDMFAAADDQAPVTVLDLAQEEEHPKTVALKKLATVMGTVVVAKELDALIKQAQAAGASDDEVAEAADQLRGLRARQEAREDLLAAMEAKAAKALAEAIARAEQTGVAAEDVAAAKEILRVEEPKERARERLLAAQSAGLASALRDALRAAQAAGLAADELKEFQDLLSGAESRDKAAEKLAEAMASRSVAALKFAIQQGATAGVDDATLNEARAILQEEEPKQRARDALRELMASDAPTVEALAAAINTAKEVKLAPAEYKDAEEKRETLEERRRRLAEVRESVEQSKSADMQDIDSVRAAKESLSGAIAAALATGVAEVDVYDAEIRRKKLHNTVEDLKGSIRVFCRIRPLSAKEKKAGDRDITRQPNPMTLIVGENDANFQFDAVFTPGSQDEIFEDCKDLVQSAVDGYNVTLFAYGQTGAGKTFTMAGKPGELGVSPRTIDELYALCENNESRYVYTIEGSMVELYRDNLVDLLSKGAPGKGKAKLNVRVEKNGAVNVEHLHREPCETAEQMMNILDRGTKARATAATAMNSESSRSHLLLMINITAVNKETKEKHTGKLLIVELAGSERLKKSMTTADAQKESIEINKSLTALGDVIEALTKGNKVVPYRNHKLTQLMQDSLGGTAKTLMFVNCSPANSNEDETLNSLKYAQRAKKITNNVKK